MQSYTNAELSKRSVLKIMQITSDIFKILTRL